MISNVDAAGTDHTPITVIEAPADAGAKLSLGDAARALRSARKPKESTDTPSLGAMKEAIEARATETHESSPADAGQDTAPETASGETTNADAEAEKLPPIEPPRSWSKDDKELFRTLPRETQERLSERERARDGDVSRRQQEATERSKALEAERSKVEQARQQYESALPILLQNLQAAMVGEFADVRTMADLQKMAAEDWPRYIRWDAQQKQVAAVQQEVQAGQQRQSQEQQRQWSEFARRQDDLLTEKVPELADADKRTRLQAAALSALEDAGFVRQELDDAYNGRLGFSLRDHRVQLIVRDAALWREAQAKARAATAKPVPPVQRPGVSHGKGAEREAQVQTLTKRLETTGSLKDAAALLRARRAAAR